MRAKDIGVKRTLFKRCRGIGNNEKQETEKLSELFERSLETSSARIQTEYFELPNSCEAGTNLAGLKKAATRLRAEVEADNQ